MDEAEYKRRLGEVGVDTSNLTANDSHTWQMLDGSEVPGVYLGRNRPGEVYVAVTNAAVTPIDPALWYTLPDNRVKAKNRGIAHIPRPGMENQALRQILPH